APHLELHGRFGRQRRGGHVGLELVEEALPERGDSLAVHQPERRPARLAELLQLVLHPAAHLVDKVVDLLAEGAGRVPSLPRPLHGLPSASLPWRFEPDSSEIERTNATPGRACGCRSSARSWSPSWRQRRWA